MAPVGVTVDYYLLLKVCQTDTIETITRSYKRLALLHHPDRSNHPDATEKFQQIAAAYETLKDPAKRREYDYIYPSIKKSQKAPPQQTPPPPPKKTPQESVDEDTAEVERLLKVKQARAERWSKTKKPFDDRIFELNRDIRRLQSAIHEYDEKDKAEDLEAAAANSWTTWAFSRVSKKATPTEEEREEKARERLQRLHSKNFKRRDLGKLEKELEIQQDALDSARGSFDYANQKDDAIIKKHRARIEEVRQREKEERDRVEREAREKAAREEEERRRKEAAKAEQERKAQEKLWRERLAQFRREQEEKERLEREARQKEKMEELARWQREAEKAEKERQAQEEIWRKEQDKRKLKAAEQEIKRLEKQAQKLRRATAAGSTTTRDYTPFTSMQSICIHDGWWKKVEGRQTCEGCLVSWTYLLKCPGCSMKRCPACQAEVRPRRRSRNTSIPNYAPPKYEDYEYD